MKSVYIFLGSPGSLAKSIKSMLLAKNCLKAILPPCLLTKTWLADDLMQNIALENNLSETAFVKMLDAENFEIQWFNPTTEVDFCGHATLASSFVIFKDYTAAKTIQFHVNLGIFTVHPT